MRYGGLTAHMELGEHLDQTTLEEYIVGVGIAELGAGDISYFRTIESEIEIRVVIAERSLYLETLTSSFGAEHKCLILVAHIYIDFLGCELRFGKIFCDEQVEGLCCICRIIYVYKKAVCVIL